MEKEKRHLEPLEGFEVSNLIIDFLKDEFDISEERATSVGTDLWFRIADKLNIEPTEEELEVITLLMTELLGE